MIGWSVTELPYPEDVVGAVRAFAADGDVCWLDSPPPKIADAPRGRYSLIAVDPCAILEQFDGQPARLLINDEPIDEAPNGWTLWRRVHDRLPRYGRSASDVSPGWVGYVGFEMARQLEHLPDNRREDLGLPLMRLALVDSAVVLDHVERRATLLHGVQVRSAIGARPVACESIVERWTSATSAREKMQSPRAPRVVQEMAPARYRQMIERALDYIAAGDIYQVNLCQRLRLERMPDAFDAHVAVRYGNPAQYAALVRWRDSAVVSASPELFLRVDGGGVLTSPIKGTAPRTGDEARDAESRQRLLDSAKDAAELAMIVDLHRNDVGRACAFGSVRVRDARRIETHPSVYHTVADIVGELTPQRDALDVLQACFPAGSISGVPKIRALEIIDELEPCARGVYTGAVGVLGLDGQMTFNVAIRTLQQKGDVANLYVGGGIVADSSPDGEYAETFDKARGVLQALGAES